MKNLLMILTVLGSISTSASFFQTSCSNADGSIKLTSGHLPSKVTLLERSYNNGKYSQNELELDFMDVEVNYENEKTIENKSSRNCTDNSGVAYWQSIYTSKVIIKMRDGSSFDDGIVGVTKSKKSVVAHMICDNSGNSMILCE